MNGWTWIFLSIGIGLGVLAAAGGSNEAGVVIALLYPAWRFLLYAIQEITAAVVRGVNRR